MKQFEIYTVSGGTFSAKPRPAVIIQSVGFDDFDSITVIPITSEELISEFRVWIEPSDDNGLLFDSRAMVDKITTLKKSHLGTLLGELEDNYKQNLESTVAKFIGIEK